jgi:hypothetical protein
MIEEMEEGSEEVMKEAKEEEMADSHSLSIRRVIVDNGIAQFVCCFPCSVSVLFRIWIPQSLEALIFPGSRRPSIATPHRPLSSVTFESESRLTHFHHHFTQL